MIEVILQFKTQQTFFFYFGPSFFSVRIYLFSVLYLSCSAGKTQIHKSPNQAVNISLETEYLVTLIGRFLKNKTLEDAMVDSDIVTSTVLWCFKD